VEPPQHKQRVGACVAPPCCVDSSPHPREQTPAYTGDGECSDNEEEGGGRYAGDAVEDKAVHAAECQRGDQYAKNVAQRAGECRIQPCAEVQFLDGGIEAREEEHDCHGASNLSGSAFVYEGKRKS